MAVSLAFLTAALIAPLLVFARAAIPSAIASSLPQPNTTIPKNSYFNCHPQGFPWLPIPDDGCAATLALIRAEDPVHMGIIQHWGRGGRGHKIWEAPKSLCAVSIESDNWGLVDDWFSLDDLHAAAL